MKTMLVQPPREAKEQWEMQGSSGFFSAVLDSHSIFIVFKCVIIN